MPFNKVELGKNIPLKELEQIIIKSIEELGLKNEIRDGYNVTAYVLGPDGVNKAMEGHINNRSALDDWLGRGGYYVRQISVSDPDTDVLVPQFEIDIYGNNPAYMIISTTDDVTAQKNLYKFLKNICDKIYHPTQPYSQSAH